MTPITHIDNCRVSPEWGIVLSTARKAGVRFRINSARRTMVEQQRLYDQNMSNGRPRPGRPLTARPDRNAPHIREGQANHALDVNALDGGETRLQRWLEKQGCHPTNPVPGEAWHLDLSEPELKALAARLSDPFRGYRADEKRWIREYERLPKKDSARGQVLRAAMAKRRKAIWRTAKVGGWSKLHRKARYDSLRARSGK